MGSDEDLGFSREGVINEPSGHKKAALLCVF